jgi:uncharacterized membrane protein
MKTALMIAIIVLSSSAGDVSLTKGIKQVGEITTLNLRELFRIACRALANRYFLAGIFFMAVSFFSFIAVLSWADLSLVDPATALSLVVNIAGAKLILKEKVNRLRLAGTLLVCLGVALVSLQ